MASIRRNLLVALLSALFLVGLAASAATFFAARRQANELFDYQLRQIALSLRDQAPTVSVELFPQFDFDFIIQIWGAHGSLVYVSNRDIVLPLAAWGFTTISAEGEEWRVYTMDPAMVRAGQIIQVALPVSLRSNRAGAIALRILIPIVASFPLFALLIWWLVGRELRPLEKIAQAIRSRDPSSLQPIPETGLPAEVRPLVAELNRLLERLGSAMEGQKRFTEDAAHELRSPLTALQLQIQLVERAHSAEERTEALDRLKAGAKRASRLVEQLLAMARLKPQAVQRARAEVNLQRLAANVLKDFEPLAAAKRIALRLGRVEPSLVQGEESALRTLAGNLVDNAIRHTPPGGSVTLDAFSDGGRAVLQVIDTGPGIPAAERERVFDRFYRLPGSEAGGSGLGLAMVKQIAAAHGASIELGHGEDGRGLRVTLRFPQA
jgi:two-component system OmpR family sensor kinase